MLLQFASYSKQINMNIANTNKQWASIIRVLKLILQTFCMITTQIHYALGNIT